MKHLKSISLLLVMATIAASCGNSNHSALEKKKEELVKLKEERKTINTKISKLEIEITKLDSSATNHSKGKLVAIKSIESIDHMNKHVNAILVYDMIQIYP